MSTAVPSFQKKSEKGASVHRLAIVSSHIRDNLIAVNPLSVFEDVGGWQSWVFSLFSTRVPPVLSNLVPSIGLLKYGFN